MIFLQIKPVDYVEMISCMRPNIWATLADEVPAWVSEKRNKTSVDRTVRWLDECIALSSVNDRKCFPFQLSAVKISTHAHAFLLDMFDAATWKLFNPSDVGRWDCFWIHCRRLQCGRT